MCPRSSCICASADSRPAMSLALISFRGCETSFRTCETSFPQLRHVSRVAVFRPITHVAPIADRITVTITAAVAIHVGRRSIAVLRILSHP